MLALCNLVFSSSIFLFSVRIHPSERNILSSYMHSDYTVLLFSLFVSSVFKAFWPVLSLCSMIYNIHESWVNKNPNILSLFWQGNYKNLSSLYCHFKLAIKKSFTGIFFGPFVVHGNKSRDTWAGLKEPSYLSLFCSLCGDIWYSCVQIENEELRRWRLLMKRLFHLLLGRQIKIS